jgi:molecular chaperone GrpE
METEATPAGDAAPAESPSASELEALRTKLADETARADENRAQLLYALADFENFKKRSERQLLDRLVAGRKVMLAKFLPVLDNLERALAFEVDSEGLRGGLDATLRGFESLLASEGVKPLTLVGAPFDPRVAETIGARETEDAADDTVLEEVQRGYTLGDELLRPARVIVARRGASKDAAETQE